MPDSACQILHARFNLTTTMTLLDRDARGEKAKKRGGSRWDGTEEEEEEGGKGDLARCLGEELRRRSSLPSLLFASQQHRGVLLFPPPRPLSSLLRRRRGKWEAEAEEGCYTTGVVGTAPRISRKNFGKRNPRFWLLRTICTWNVRGCERAFVPDTLSNVRRRLFLPFSSSSSSSLRALPPLLRLRRNGLFLFFPPPPTSSSSSSSFLLPRLRLHLSVP